MVELAGRLMELRARLSGRSPQLTYRLARDYAGDVPWVTSEKAETELGYTHRHRASALWPLRGLVSREGLCAGQSGTARSPGVAGDVSPGSERDRRDDLGTGFALGLLAAAVSPRWQQSERRT